MRCLASVVRHRIGRRCRPRGTMEMETRSQGTADSPYDVLILGGGWSGLLACKYCKDAGLRPLVLEKRATIGGVWAFTDEPTWGGVMKNTRTTSSKCITEISDYPMPEDYPDFLHHTEILSYLTRYGAHFDLFPHICLGAEVTRAAK